MLYVTSPDVVSYNITWFSRLADPLTGFTMNTLLFELANCVPVAFKMMVFAPVGLAYAPMAIEFSPWPSCPAPEPIATAFAPWESFPAEAPIATAYCP